jgi:Chlorophyllase enzyme
LILVCSACSRCGGESDDALTTPAQVTSGADASGSSAAGGTGTSTRATAGANAAMRDDAAHPEQAAGSSAQMSAAGRDSSAAAAGAPAAGGSGAAPAAGTPAAGHGAPPAGTGTAGTPAADSGLPRASLPPVTTTDGPGPFETTQDLQAGPSGSSGLFWPTDLGKDGIQHPVFVFGCGGGTTPSTYAELMSEVASHGFVVIAEAIQIGDMGAPLREALDWISAEAAREGSELNGKLDVSKIALGGHSIGSANGFMVADDPRLTTTIHVAGGSLDMGSDINAPTTGSGGKRLIHPVAYVCSEMDQFGNVEKTLRDYESTTAPAWMTVMTGVDHVGAFREGMGPIIAWLRWHLAGESERRSAFLDAAGEYNTGRYVSMNKNW